MSGGELLTYGKWVLFFGIPFALGVAELWNVSRIIREREARERDAG